MKEGEQRQGPRAPWARARSPSEATPTYLGVALAHAPDDAPDHHDAAHGVEGAVDLGPVVAHEERAEGQQEEPQHNEADAEGLLISHGCLGGRGTRADARTHTHTEKEGAPGPLGTGLRVEGRAAPSGSSSSQGRTARPGCRSYASMGPGRPPTLTPSRLPSGPGQSLCACVRV